MMAKHCHFSGGEAASGAEVLGHCHGRHHDRLNHVRPSLRDHGVLGVRAAAAPPSIDATGRASRRNKEERDA